MPGEKEQKQVSGTPPSDESAIALRDRDVYGGGDKTRATYSASDRSLVKRRGGAPPTAITATATPQEQSVGHAIMIAGQLTSGGGAHMVAVPVALYNTDDPTNKVRIAETVTDASGHYQFTLTDSVATTHKYIVRAEGSSKYSRAQSTEVLVTYYLVRLRDTTRVALAPAVRAQTVFNLSWSELLAIFLILASEGLRFTGYSTAGVGVQALNIVVIVSAIGVLQGDRVELLEALALVSLLRVVNLSFVLIPTVTLYWLVAIYGVMLIPIVLVIVHRQLSRDDLGLRGGRPLLYLIPFGILVGVELAFIEYLYSHKSCPRNHILTCLAYRTQRRDDLCRTRGRAAFPRPATNGACITQWADCRHTRHKYHLWCDAIGLRQLLRVAFRIRSRDRFWRRLLQNKELAVCHHDARGEQHTPIRGPSICPTLAGPR